MAAPAEAATVTAAATSKAVATAVQRRPLQHKKETAASGSAVLFPSQSPQASTAKPTLDGSAVVGA